MSNHNDIFKKLGEHEVKPPHEVTLNIFKNTDDKQIHEEISLKKHFGQLQELEINPPINTFTFIKNKIASSYKLSFLQEAEIVPPPAVYSSIVKKIKQDKQQTVSGSRAIVKTIYRYSAVAAILLIVLTGWFTYEAFDSSGKTEIEPPKKSIARAPVKADSAIADTITNKISVESPVKDAGTIAENYSIGEYNFPVINNDLLATFAGFTYQEVPSFIRDAEAKKFTIRIDQYSSIAVSASMSNMIGRMNRFRHNQKLTRNAKKTRSTLEKWKKADAVQFNKSPVNNPLNAIDLAEFIFN